MPEGNRERVRLIRDQFAVQSEYQLNHVLNLLLLRFPGTHHGLLDHPRRIFRDRKPRYNAGADCRAAGLPKLQGRRGILGNEHLLDRHLGGPEAIDDFRDLPEYLSQTLGDRSLRGGTDTAGSDVVAMDTV